MLSRSHTLGLRAAALVGALVLQVPWARGADPKPGGDPDAGKTVFMASCMICHGPAGHGDGAAAAALNPKPANLSDAAQMAKSSETRRFKVVHQGGASAGLSPVMPAFQAILTEQQIRDVLSYVESAFIPKAEASRK